MFTSITVYPSDDHSIPRGSVPLLPPSISYLPLMRFWEVDFNRHYPLRHRQRVVDNYFVILTTHAFFRFSISVRSFSLRSLSPSSSSHCDCQLHHQQNFLSSPLSAYKFAPGGSLILQQDLNTKFPSFAPAYNCRASPSSRVVSAIKAAPFPHRSTSGSPDWVWRFNKAKASIFRFRFAISGSLRAALSNSAISRHW